MILATPLARPPVEAGGGLDPAPLRPQRLTARHQHVGQRRQIGKRPVRDRLVDQGPDPFDRLEFGRGRRQGDEVEPLRDRQPFRRVPARLVEHQDGSMRDIEPFVGGKGGQG